MCKQQQFLMIIQLIKQGRKSLLFTQGNIWIKKIENTSFDVTVGSEDGQKASVYVKMTDYLLLKMQTDLNLIV